MSGTNISTENTRLLEPPGNSQAQLHRLRMASLQESDTHNVLAYLKTDSRNSPPFIGIISYLLRSRIFKAISADYTPYLTHQQQFWKSAVLDDEKNPSMISSKVFGKQITVSTEVLREVLEFGDVAGDPLSLNKFKVRGLFARIKYSGEIKEGTIRKSGLCPQYKYLAHVLQQCLSGRRSGHDELGATIEHAFAALILNHPFNLSALIFSNLVDNMTTKREPFLMYPRFLQMIIDLQAPQIPKFDSDVIKLKHMGDLTLKRMTSFKGKTEETKPPEKRLVGHLVKADYQCPGGKNWRNDDSGSEDEGIVPAPDSDDDNSDGEGDNLAESAPEGRTSLRDEEAGEEEPRKKKKKRSADEGSGRVGLSLSSQRRKINLTSL